jgi:hypothetical protein
MTAKNDVTKTTTLDDSTESTPRLAGVETMKAIVQDAYGTAPEDVLRFEEIARPTIGANEVLVRVRAASVDRGTWHLMTGLPRLGVRPPFSCAPTRRSAGFRTADSPG